MKETFRSTFQQAVVLRIAKAKQTHAQTDACNERMVTRNTVIVNFLRRIVIFVVTIGSLFLGNARGIEVAIAADDDRDVIEEILLDREEFLRLGVQRNVNDHLINKKMSEFEFWLFGPDASFVRKMVEAQCDRVVYETLLKYELTPTQQKKLILAASADKVRFFNQVEDLRFRYEDPRSGPAEMQKLMVDAKALRLKQKNMFGSDSFFAKATKGMLRVESPMPEKNVTRHLSNIEGAIRAIEREVKLQNSQRDMLIRILLRESRPPRSLGDFDDIVVKYRLSQLPHDKLRDVFYDEQWPKVSKILDGFREFGPVLIHHQLIESPAATKQSTAFPLASDGVPTPIDDPNVATASPGTKGGSK